MPKKKRINPNKIPITPSTVDMHALMIEASKDNMLNAWLLVIPELMRVLDLSDTEVFQVWDEVNNYIDAMPAEGEALAACAQNGEQLIGLPTPYRHALKTTVRTKGDLEVLKRHLKEKAVHAALSLIALGLNNTGRCDEGLIRRIFLNVSLTRAEIEAGRTSYESLLKDIQARGIMIDEDGESVDIASGQASN